jgi:Uri superfamily endonuclease
MTLKPVPGSGVPCPTMGAYILLFRLPALTGVRIGKLGIFDLPEGRYAYVGSAMNGLEARTERHLSGEGRKRWHIDYLMDRAVEKEALRFPGTADLECSLSNELRGSPGVKEPIDRFGSSDCRCRSHLFLLDEEAEALLRNKVQGNGKGRIR